VTKRKTPRLPRGIAAVFFATTKPQTFVNSRLTKSRQRVARQMLLSKVKAKPGLFECVTLTEVSAA
jgi:hypothetical protein